jgi:hypothetical protein
MAAPATVVWLSHLPAAIDANLSSLPDGLYIVKLTATADFDYAFAPEHPMWAMVLGGDGSDGGGTLSLQGGVDGTNFYALPQSTSLTAAGVATVARNDLGFPYYNVHLTGSTNPTLTCYVAWWANGNH